MANIGKSSEKNSVYDCYTDRYVHTESAIGRGAGERLPGLTTGANAAQAGQVAAPESGCAAGPTSLAEKLHVKPQSPFVGGSLADLAYSCSNEWRDGLPAKQFDRDQAVRDEIHRRYADLREQVARQQSNLLNQLGEEAMAPAYETATPTGYGLGSRIESLETQVRLLNKQLAALGQQLTDIQRRAYLPQPKVRDEGQRAQLHEHTGCNHEFYGKDSTVVAITRRKSRCTVCAQVWETA